MKNKPIILITAGPTREYIDPVRYISNDSSGEMGFALAEAAKKTGAKVTLICGPLSVGHLFEKNPAKCRTLKGGYRQISVRHLNVVSAREMFEAVKKNYKKADIIIMAAAVADWRPFRCSSLKLKKRTIAPSGHRTIALVQNPDILAWLGKHKRPNQILIGFALETENLLKNAQNKLKNKKCDVIVGNLAKNIGKKGGSAVIITKNGYKKHIKNTSKKAIAKAILAKCKVVDFRLFDGLNKSKIGG
ncbi:MAG: phosphopantothenoylcysteine decarboxylase [Deltaproteobacteria bacterium]|nr:phosphopantothenoylcysteine decarboxylase [Deltaproteobacteria bacterium]MBI2974903.1 phosphopantothenoylcysteine decarboxylase [Deltaproteobacteria bacterium]